MDESPIKIINKQPLSWSTLQEFKNKMSAKFG
jgi:hypothetical protein